MNFKTILSFLLVVVFLGVATDTEAQRRKRKSYKKRKQRSKSISHYKGGTVGGRFRPYTYVGFNLNALNYYGDLAPVNKAASTDISFTRPGFGFDLGYKFHPYASIRGSVNWGRIKGDDIGSYQSGETEEKWQARYARNLSFRNDITEATLGFELQFLPNHGGPSVRPPLNGYLFIGASIYHHEPKGKVPEFDYQNGGTVAPPSAGEWVKLRELNTEGQGLIDPQGDVYSPFGFSVPIALGVRLRLPGPFEAGIELGYRWIFTDYLDDVSGNYVDLDRFDNDLSRIMSDRSSEPEGVWTGEQRDLTLGNVFSREFADGETYSYAVNLGSGQDGSVRGNPDNNDMYFVTSLKLRYVIGRTRSSAKFR